VSRAFPLWIWMLLFSIGILFSACARGIPGERLPEGSRPTAPPPGRTGGQGTVARPPASPPRPSPIEEPSGEAMTLEGRITAVIPGGYQVDGHRVHVSPEADAEGPLPVGVYVTVVGIARPDGSIEAEVLEVLRRPGAEREWEGTLEQVRTDGYQIDGRRAFVLPTTEVIGDPKPGSSVYLSGFEQPDGSLVADTVIVIETEP